MNKYSLLLLLFSVLSSQAQSYDKKRIEHFNTEKKSAASKMAFTPNPNTANYDIQYHRLRLTVDPAVHFINGEVTTKYRAKQDMNTISFDLSNDLQVSAVKQRGIDLVYSRTTNNELLINLPQTQNTNVLDSLSITYSGIPPSSGFGAFVTDQHAGTPVLWTLSEPFGAMEWWPCKQDLNDKANSIDVYITTPAQYVSVSNGVEPAPPTVNGNTKTTHFRHNYPIPAYLIAIAVTNYSVYNQQAGTAPNQYPIINYLYPESLDANKTNLDQTHLLLDFYESIFTPYPYRTEKYGHAQFGWGGGMEHTTVSFMVSFSRDLIAHEMAHQWFGDKVTCGSWNDIWLNEGFATYLAAMVIEHFDGEGAFISNKIQMINNITSVSNGAVYLSDTEATDVNRIFSSRLSYDKGAMVLNMLRFKLGDTAFFSGLKNYLNDPALAYGYAQTPDLQAHLEVASGTNLTEFFADWIYNQGYPSYTIVAQNTGPNQVRITVNQSQSDASVSFFEMPIPIRLLGTNGEVQDFVLDNNTNGQVFDLAIPFSVRSVLFDPKRELISKNNSASLGSTDFGTDVALSVYPNPANNQLTLNLPRGLRLEKTECYSVLGQKIRETGSQTNWDISALANGIYMLKVYTDKGLSQLKFVKN